MKTTVVISDVLLERARELLATEQTTLRRIIEEHAERKPFKFRDASFRGRGLRPEVREADGRAIRALACEGRGR